MEIFGDRLPGWAITTIGGGDSFGGDDNSVSVHLRYETGMDSLCSFQIVLLSLGHKTRIVLNFKLLVRASFTHNTYPPHSCLHLRDLQREGLPQFGNIECIFSEHTLSIV